ncbi:MAG TPA: hypothetical protein VJ600_08615 [Holophagaceae bacterium]|nr:hypothetical protein [Holophagaceae bacterium]
MEGTRLLVRHPGITFGLLLFAVLLGQLGPALELLAGAPNTVPAQLVFGFAALLPLEIYALPRWLARLDAETVDAPANPRSGWQPGFDQRWLRAFGAKMLVLLLGAMGCVLILPTLLVFTFFGWAPLRMLLRGDRLGEAMRWSGRAMVRVWPRMVQAALAILIVWMLGQLLLRWEVGVAFPSALEEAPEAMVRLRHPAFWIAGAIAGIFHLWTSAAFLALYQRLERLVQSSEAK